jgi:hypothetical protein
LVVGVNHQLAASEYYTHKTCLDHGKLVSKAWRRTICSARISVRAPSSWIRVVRWSA